MSWNREEFAVIGFRSLEAARTEAELFRRAVAADRTIPITVSIGIALVDEADPPGTPQHLLQRADSAMYRAKRSGGNQVVIDGPQYSEDSARRVHRR